MEEHKLEAGMSAFEIFSFKSKSKKPFSEAFQSVYGFSLESFAEGAHQN